ncbi:MAG TPA: alpha/beta fold hydrolase [Phycicoccus sp.]|nr:alpha/beta fold hydrolase [Phycicoccus sp.]
MAAPTTGVLRRVAVGSAVAAGSAALAGAAGSLAGAAYFARKVLTPELDRPDDLDILEVGTDRLVLSATEETVVPGRYGLWLAGGAGHARIGDLLATDPASGTVTRELLGLDRGVLAPGPARWNSYYWGDPPEVALGLPTREVFVPGELGRLPTWLVSAAEGPGTRWAVLVHGRGALREETLRAIRPLRALGWTCLVPSYRNDEGVAPGPDGRYNLGLSEWRDVEAAVRYAVRQGARQILLAGWSMGGAIVLQFLDRSPLSRFVVGAVLDGPVIDWGDVLAFHGRLNHVPRPILGLSRAMMGRTWGKRLVGVHDVLDVARTDWVGRADELRHPLLVMHSADDEFVPVGPSRALAHHRPDLVTYEEFTTARHCKEWNVDPARWEGAVADFVTGRVPT